MAGKSEQGQTDREVQTLAMDGLCNQLHGLGKASACLFSRVLGDLMANKILLVQQEVSNTD